MAEKKIIWTNLAAKQLRHITSFWTEHNKSNKYSLKLIDKVEYNFNGVLKNPKRCSETTFLGVRVSSLGHFSIFYKIDSAGIVILSFWDNRQNPNKLVELLKKNES